MADELVYGLRPVGAILARHPQQVLEIWVQEGRRAAAGGVLSEASRHAISVHFVPRRSLDAMVRPGPHQGVVARCRRSGAEAPSFEGLLETLREDALLLVLDGVQDPHNLGACLRTAQAAGVQALLAPRHRAVGVTAVVRKVACGAAETTPLIRPPNLARALDSLRSRGVWIVGAESGAERSLFEVDLRTPLAMVLGGEARGLRRLTREKCDVLVRIPMSGAVGSLNVSVAAGICLFEAVRRRGLGAH